MAEMPSFSALPLELLADIVRRTSQALPEYGYVLPYGHYAPSVLDPAPLDVDRRTRNIAHEQLCMDFAFVEAYYRGCVEHLEWRDATFHFESAFRAARYEKVIHLRAQSHVNLSTIRIDVRCPCGCQGESQPEKLLVFTEATPFANILVANMIQSLFVPNRRLEVSVTLHSETSAQRIQKTIVSMCRYVRNTNVIRVSGGIHGPDVQHITNVLGIQQETMDMAALANLQRNHMRDVQNMLAEGLSVDQLVPVAYWFSRAYSEKMSHMDQQVRDSEDQEELWQYVLHLNDNNTDLMVRGVAHYMLSQPAQNPHFTVSKGYEEHFSTEIVAMQHNIPLREDHLKLLQEASLRPSAVLSRDELRDRFKVHEMHKTDALISVALARHITIPWTELPDSTWQFAFQLTRNRGNLLEDCETAVEAVHTHTTKPVEERTARLDNPTLKEWNGFWKNTIWKQQVDLCMNAVRRAAVDQGGESNDGMDIIRNPCLYTTDLWTPSWNLFSKNPPTAETKDNDDNWNDLPGAAAADEFYNVLNGVQDRLMNPPTKGKNKYCEYPDMPTDIRDDFEDLLYFSMTDYILPFYSDPETLNSVHESFEARGLC